MVVPVTPAQLRRLRSNTVDPAKARRKGRKARPPVEREASVLRACREYLELALGKENVWRLNSGTVFAHGRRMELLPEGTADLLAWSVTVKLPATLVFIECKTRAGKLRPAQERFRDWCASIGALYVVARSQEDVAKIVPLRRKA